MTDWTQLIDAGFQKLGELAGKYGPPAIETAASVVRIDAISTIAWGVMGLAVAIPAAIASNRLLVLSQRLHREYWNPAVPSDDPRDGQSMMVGAVGVGLGVGSLVGAVTFLFNACSVWSWVALFDPKLALAAKVVHAIPGLGQ